jgi:ribosomal protein S18 acetylase RimI-like enzyme
VADGQGVAGYIVGTADAKQFERWREEHWFQAIRDQYPLSALGQESPNDERYLKILHAPPRGAAAFPSLYPAELHIKLDPRVARQGWGTQLIHQLIVALRQRPVSGLHLLVSVENAGAVAFYSQLGFARGIRTAETLMLTKLLG